MLNNIAIIAGSGKLPFIVAKFLRKNKINFIVISLKKITTVSFSKKYKNYSLSLGNGKKAIKILKENSIKNILFLGALNRPTLYNLKPDLWSFFKIFKSIFFNYSDDNLLRKVITIFEQEGFKVIGLSDLTDKFFLKKGVYGQTDKKVNMSIINNILPKVIKWTKKDIGQSVISSKKSILLYENRDGTDNLIERLSKNKNLSKNSYLFIKVKKIDQDNRIDLPTIGYETIKNLVKSNIKYIILQADSTIVLDKKKIFYLVKKFNKVIISVNINYFLHNENCYIDF